MSEFIKSNHFAAIDGDVFHYGDQAHQYWATTLRNYAQEYIL
jgi:hypothetical protein